MITKNKLRILCLCKGGLVRSVAFKQFIVYNYDDTDVLAAGGITVQMNETRAMLLDWAELIFVLSGSAFKELVKDYPQHVPRMVYVAIGKDIWSQPSHPDLKKVVEGFAP